MKLLFLFCVMLMALSGSLYGQEGYETTPPYEIPPMYETTPPYYQTPPVYETTPPYYQTPPSYETTYVPPY